MSDENNKLSKEKLFLDACFLIGFKDKILNCFRSAILSFFKINPQKLLPLEVACIER